MKYRIPILILALLLLTPAIFALFFKRVPPDVIGIKQSRWGGGGIQALDFGTGFHLGVSGYHLWHFLPRRTHFIHFSESRGQNTEVDLWEPPQQIRTRDNNVVTVDLSVPYRIKNGEANTIISDGLKHGYRDRVKSTVERVLRSELSSLSSEDLQNTELRIQRTEAILPILNEQLAEFHVVAQTVLVRRFLFSSEYERKLQEKQFLRQKANLDVAQTHVANEEKLVNQLEKQIKAAEMALETNWRKTLQEKSSEYEGLLAEIYALAQVYSERTRAEGSAGQVISEAEGNLALARAEALRQRLRTAALSNPGGDVLIALRAAENMQIPSVTLDGQDPSVPMLLDLSRMTELLLGSPAAD